jgi:3-hydroxybutyryl-CoA dehydrogenase
VSSGGQGAARVIGVLGAGTMGAGIAQLACVSGARALMHDPVPEALARGRAGIEKALARGVERGRLSQDDATAALERLEPVADMGGLADCDLVIEAAPESLEIKHEIYRRLAEVVSAECVLATNTSSLPVTAIAAVVPDPGRVVGMHFFNPAPVMRLLEIVAGDASDERSLALARATGEAMGKVCIDAADGPGFLVNRCNRPFGLLGGPPGRPSPITQRMADAGRHGRKAGRGYYDYGAGPHRPEDPPAPEPVPGSGLIVIGGDGPIAAELHALAGAAGWEVRWAAEAEGAVPELIVDCGLDEEDPPLQGGPQLLLCDEGSLAALDPAGGAVGFHALPPLADAALVELTRGPGSSEAAVQAAERFFASLGKHVQWVGDAPALVLGRIVCQVINEAAFALGEGVGSARDIDLGMVHGLNQPRGPLEWADAIGLDHVLAVLEGLCDEYREERYRPAPELRRLVREGRLGRHVGAGFHDYDS